MYFLTHSAEKPCPWNKGKLTGQKSLLKSKEVWSIRVRLQLSGNRRDLALFNLAIDSKLLMKFFLNHSSESKPLI